MARIKAKPVYKEEFRNEALNMLRNSDRTIREVSLALERIGLDAPHMVQIVGDGANFEESQGVAEASSPGRNAD